MASVRPASRNPAQVGDMVLEGVERDAAYIITHRDHWPAIERRMEAIRIACADRKGA
jgi:hypothetical protein